jgi:hypothetical protein
MLHSKVIPDCARTVSYEIESLGETFCRKKVVEEVIEGSLQGKKCKL